MSHHWAEPVKRPRGPLRRTIVIIEEPTEAVTTPNATTLGVHGPWSMSSFLKAAGCAHDDRAR
jgi:hypothetical protein